METQTITKTTTAILASDFDKDTRNKRRNHWNSGSMRHLIKALDGAPVIVTVDRGTGHTLVGVVLRGLRQTPGYGTTQVLVDNTWFGLEFGIGEAIIPMVETNAKWEAMNSLRRESSAAIKKACADFPECDWGTWTVRAHDTKVDVSYEPRTTNPAYADRWGKHTYTSYRLSELA